MLSGKVNPEVCQWGCWPLKPLHRASQLGKEVRKLHPIMNWVPLPRSPLYPLPRPPFVWGVEVGRTHYAHCHVVVFDGLRVIQPRGRICTPGSVPEKRVPYSSSAKYRPPLTMIEGYGLAVRPCSLTFPCWSVDPPGQRGPVRALNSPWRPALLGDTNNLPLA